MEYRELGTTGMKVGTISMGCEGFSGNSSAEVKQKLDFLLGEGCNFLEMYNPESEFRKNVGAAVRGRRDKIFLQSHLCAIMEDGQYLRTRELGKVKAGFDQMLSEIGTDYIDVGMIHYVDSVADWEDVVNNGVLDYALELKKAGKIRHIGMSSHNPEAAKAAVDSGSLEVLLFSINPCYDMQPADEDVEKIWADESYAHELQNQDAERKKLYELCESKGIGIDVMKAFGGGDLLDEKMSPFGRAFTPAQCIHYCLTRPAVAAVMLGCKSIDEWKAALKYYETSEAERDYSGVLTGMDRFKFEGHCMYCGHCAPCTVGIDVASVTKYLNLALAEGELRETVREHYKLLSHHASECIGCGNCEQNCPFHVEIIQNMKKAAEVFGY